MVAIHIVQPSTVFAPGRRVHTPLFPALWRLSQKDLCGLEVSLVYMVRLFKKNVFEVQLIIKDPKLNKAQFLPCNNS